MFDFDGTLTSTPGDRQVRVRKRAELCERAPMLRQHLHCIREAGCLMGVISKSSEDTIRSSLEAGGLLDYFDAPIVARANGFEGKVGFLQELARHGSLRRPGDRRSGPAPHRVLLVDDDVLELDRAAAAGFQTYAAPAQGGLTEEDFAAIRASLHLGPNRSRATRFHRQLSRSPSLDEALAMTSSLPMQSSSGKWRNLILFSGECFEG